jgi:hypothetical protein
MPMFMLTHTHSAAECPVAFASWRGFESPLRSDLTLASCGPVHRDSDEHRIWWSIEAESEEAALGLLPPFVAERTEVSPVSEVPIP